MIHTGEKPNIQCALMHFHNIQCTNLLVCESIHTGEKDMYADIKCDRKDIRRLQIFTDIRRYIQVKALECILKNLNAFNHWRQQKIYSEETLC